MATSTLFVNQSGNGAELEGSNGIRLCYTLAEDFTKSIVGPQSPLLYQTEQWTETIINTGIKYCSDPIRFALRLYQYDAVLVQVQHLPWLSAIIQEGIETNLFDAQHWQSVLDFLQESIKALDDILIFNDVQYANTAQAWKGWKSENKPGITPEGWRDQLCLDGKDALFLLRTEYKRSEQS